MGRLRSTKLENAGETPRYLGGGLGYDSYRRQSPSLDGDMAQTAGRFNMALEEKDPALFILARHIPLRYTVLEGKHIRKKGVECFMSRLPRKCAEITLDEPVELLNNLKMNLVDVDLVLASKDFYGKVIEDSGEDSHSSLVRFTSVAAEVRSYFQAHRQYATKTAVNGPRNRHIPRDHSSWPKEMGCIH